jgi:predicted NBD/HSP70 family sugar kinase
VRTSDVFELLRDGRPRTRAQLADATGLARSTVGARLEALLRLGLVTPYGGGTSTGGRPPSLFALNPTARVVAAVDLGATHAVAAVTDLSGTILAHRGERLDIAQGPGVVLDWVERTVRDLLRRARRPQGDLAAVGIGVPGPVEHSTGRPINPPIMPGWDRYDVAGHLGRELGVPVLVDNDVNIMALGERSTHLAEVDDLVFIKVATGIGAGIITGGRLQRGAQGTAGDLGHVRVSHAGGVICRCGNEGCLEAIAAGPAVAQRLRADGLPAQDTQAVVDLVRGGNVAALREVRQAGRDLGEVVATMINLINPSVVVIGGLLAGAGEHLLAGIREVVYQRSLPLATEHLRIVASRAADRAGVLGASVMAVEHVLSPEAIDAAAADSAAGATPTAVAVTADG